MGFNRDEWLTINKSGPFDPRGIEHHGKMLSTDGQYDPEEQISSHANGNLPRSIVI